VEVSAASAAMAADFTLTSVGFFLLLFLRASCNYYNYRIAPGRWWSGGICRAARGGVWV
jgi:hypothetical protein